MTRVISDADTQEISGSQGRENKSTMLRVNHVQEGCSVDRAGEVKRSDERRSDRYGRQDVQVACILFCSLRCTMIRHSTACTITFRQHSRMLFLDRPEITSPSSSHPSVLAFDSKVELRFGLVQHALHVRSTAPFMQTFVCP